MTRREEFETRGFIVVRGLFAASEVEEWRAAVASLSGLSSRSQRPSRSWQSGRLPTGWTLPDGVSREPRFWPLAVDPRLREVAIDVLGRKARFLQHTDLHAGFSAFTWHRDSVDRRFRPGAPDFDEHGEPYRLVRVGLYLHEGSAASFALGLVPGSHRPAALAPSARAEIESALAWPRQVWAVLSRRDPLRSRAEWVPLGDGDVVAFDPRVVHAGTPAGGPKCSLFVAYGVPGRHYARHRAYYRFQRSELGYAELRPEFAEILREQGLLAEGPDGVASSRGGYRPSWLEAALGRRLRPAARRRGNLA
jgi:hypothetical protein